jgi:hypothetical protein
LKFLKNSITGVERRRIRHVNDYRRAFQETHGGSSLAYVTMLGSAVNCRSEVAGFYGLVKTASIQVFKTAFGQLQSESVDCE